MEVNEMKENYNANLKAKAYNEKFNRIVNLMRGNFEFMLKFLHDVVQSGRFTGSKVLEIGSGATVHSIASASMKFSNIVQSDYVQDNCDELKRWHAQESPLDWSQFLDIVVQFESKCNPQCTRQNLENRIRSSVKSVIRLDLLSDDMFLEQLPNSVQPPFDMVISVLCIETAAPDFDGYVAILKRINKVLKQHGGLIVCGYENGSNWQVEGSTFHHVRLTLGQISDALANAGFGNVELKTRLKTPSEYKYDYDSLFCFAAEKV